MIGDFIFALSTFPIKLGLELWEKRFRFDPSYYYSTGILDTETETETETTTDVSSEPPPPPEPHTTQTQRASPNRKPDEVTFPRKGARRPTSGDANAHQPIASSSRTRSKHDIEPNFYSTSSASPQQQRQKLKGRQHEVWYPPPSAYAGNDEHLQDNRTTTTTTTASLIELDVQVTTEKQKLEDAEEWRQYPDFPSAYPPTPLVTTSRLVSTRGAIRTTTNMYPIIREEDLKDAEEWRRYPAFPAAYPPTPLVVSGAMLHSIGSGGSHHPSVVKEEGEEGEGEGEGEEEEERERGDGNDGPEEDFRGSLQLLREPLNPSSASDSSDSYRSSYGIHNQNDFRASSFSALPAAGPSSDSDSDTEIYSDVDDDDDKEEEEDNFNITLQTPLHRPLGVVIPIPIPRNQRPVSMTSTLASASTGLTTLHDGSLRTGSSGSGSDGGGGGGEDDEIEEEGEDGEKENTATSFTAMPSSSSVLGKKRALQGQGDRGDVMRKAKGTESPHGHGKSGTTKKRRVSTSQSPTRQQRAGLAAFTTEKEGNVQFSSASEGREAERARTPTPTNTKTKSGGRSRRRRTPLSPSRVNAPRSPLHVNTAPSPLRGNGTRSSPRRNAKRSPLQGNRTLSPSQVNATTTRAVRPRVTRYATPPPPLPMTLGSMGIEAMTTAPGSTTTGTETTTENRILVAPRQPDPILIPDEQTRRGSQPQVPTAQRSSRRLRSGESAAQARKPNSAALASGDPDSVIPEPRRRRTAVNLRTATNARSTRK